MSAAFVFGFSWPGTPFTAKYKGVTSVVVSCTCCLSSLMAAPSKIALVIFYEGKMYSKHTFAHVHDHINSLVLIHLVQKGGVVLQHIGGGLVDLLPVLGALPLPPFSLPASP